MAFNPDLLRPEQKLFDLECALDQLLSRRAAGDPTAIPELNRVTLEIVSRGSKFVEILIKRGLEQSGQLPS